MNFTMTLLFNLHDGMIRSYIPVFNFVVNDLSSIKPFVHKTSCHSFIHIILASESEILNN